MTNQYYKDEISRQNLVINNNNHSTPKLFAGETLLRTLQYDGYENEGQSIADIVDNSIEAGSSRIDVLFNRKQGSRSDIIDIAIVDNGSGIQKEFLQQAIAFGGSSKNDRTDCLGYFGVGLSKGGIAFGDHLSVISKIADNEWTGTFIDLRQDSPTKFTDEFLHKNDYSAPIVDNPEIPRWIVDQLGENFPDNSGTIIILSSLDPMKRKWGPRNFQQQLQKHLGIIHYQFAGKVEIYVNNQIVEFIDPLFLTKGLRGFDLDADRAQEFPGFSAEIFHNNKSCGIMSARFAFYPPTFGIKKEFKATPGAGASGNQANLRASIMRQYNGIILSRNGRIIGCDANNLTKFGNNDFNIGIELSFTGEADALMGVTSKKNQVSLQDEAWDLLRDELNLLSGIQSLRKARKEAFNRHKANVMKVADENGNQIRPFEKVATIEQSTPRKKLTKEVEDKLKILGKKGFEQEVENLKVQNPGKKEDIIRDELHTKILSKNYDTEILPLKGADFVTFEPFGAQTRIIFNSDHNFYKDLFGSDGVDSYSREALGCLITSFYRALVQTQIGGSEGNKFLFDSITGINLLKTWSETLETSLTILKENFNIKDLSEDQIDDISYKDDDTVVETEKVAADYK